MNLIAFMLLGFIGWNAAADDERSRKPPVVDQIAKLSAQRVASMPDTDPVSRIIQLLEAQRLDDNALFALASTNPGLVEQLKNDRYHLGVSYLWKLPAPELHRIRKGETVVRIVENLRGTERKAAVELCEYFGFKEKWLQAIRVGPVDANTFRVEVVARKNKRKSEMSGTITLGWPSTPQRDEESREYLTKYYGARPSRVAIGAGSALKLIDGSFEDPNSLTKSWVLRKGTSFGVSQPVAEVTIDGTTAIDGFQSLRFYADQKTRLFHVAEQSVAVTPGMFLRTRVQMKAENLHVEYQQREDQVYMAVTFLDGMGTPLSEPLRSVGRLESHPWELLELQAQAPAGSENVQITLVSAVSGTAWFDAVTVEVLQ